MTEFYEFVTQTFGNWLVFTIVVAFVSFYLGMFLGALTRAASENEKYLEMDSYDENQADDLYEVLRSRRK